tara:strand:+ start:642 stop:1013 length:372 start_codon:yes stop_codon:yes gene_type:complete
MLKNYEEITKELNEYEKKTLYPLIIAGLQRHQGKDKAITGVEICKAINSKLPAAKLTGVRLRKIVQAIRMTGDLFNVCSTSRGYFVAANQEEINDCIESLQQRIDQQQKIVNALLWQQRQQVK